MQTDARVDAQSYRYSENGLDDRELAALVRAALKRQLVIGATAHGDVQDRQMPATGRQTSYLTGPARANNSVLRPESLVVPNQNAMPTPHPVVSDPSISSSAWLSLTFRTSNIIPIRIAK